MNKKQDSAPYTNPAAATAAAAYGEKAKESASTQRELEGQLLIKYAQKMKRLQDNWENISHSELDEVLSHNRKLWTLFYDTALQDQDDENGRPDDLRQNIIALSEYIFNRTIKTLAAPERDKLNILIDINKEIAAGLMARQQAAQANEDQSSSESADKSDDGAPITSQSTSA